MHRTRCRWPTAPYFRRWWPHDPAAVAAPNHTCYFFPLRRLDRGVERPEAPPLGRARCAAPPSCPHASRSATGVPRCAHLSGGRQTPSNWQFWRQMAGVGGGTALGGRKCQSEGLGAPLLGCDCVFCLRLLQAAERPAGTEGGQGGPGRGRGGSSGPGFNPLGVLQLQAGPDRMWEARWGLQVRRSGGDRIWLLVGRRRPMAGAAVGG